MRLLVYLAIAAAGLVVLPWCVPGDTRHATHTPRAPSSSTCALGGGGADAPCTVPHACSGGGGGGVGGGGRAAPGPGPPGGAPPPPPPPTHTHTLCGSGAVTAPHTHCPTPNHHAQLLSCIAHTHASRAPQGLGADPGAHAARGPPASHASRRAAGHAGVHAAHTRVPLLWAQLPGLAVPAHAAAQQRRQRG
jgi:hypothetical protein